MSLRLYNPKEIYSNRGTGKVPQSQIIHYGNLAGGVGTGLLAGYYDREGRKLDQAYQTAQPSPREEALMKQQAEIAAQSLKDRRATRNIIFAKMGLKTTPDGKLVRMSPEERAAALSSIDKLKSSAVTSYNERAEAAAKGETKLPSFLKKEVDYQADKEKALLTEMLGPDAVNSSAFQQAVSAQTKGEESLRGEIQDQDMASAPGMARELTGQMAGADERVIAGLNQLPNQGLGLMQSTAGLLQNLQQRRLDEYNKTLRRIEKRRGDISGLLTLGGTIGGGAASTIGSNREREITPTAGSTINPYQPIGSDYGLMNKSYGYRVS